MTDMLVKLYELPPLPPFIEKQTSASITIRRAMAPEMHHVSNWIHHHFDEYWVSELTVAYSRQPISCFLAIEDDTLIGFAAYDATARGFFGPTGVSQAARGKGTGAALLVACLHDMANQGYGYAIIGGVGPIDFYNKIVGATIIPDSTPGIYQGMLKQSPPTR